MAQTTLGNFLHFTFEEMEAQRGLVIHQGSHSWRTVEQGLKVRLWLKAVTLTTAPHSLITHDTGHRCSLTVSLSFPFLFFHLLPSYLTSPPFHSSLSLFLHQFFSQRIVILMVCSLETMESAESPR